jgi:beta-glucanase (GH16 family)
MRNLIFIATLLFALTSRAVPSDYVLVWHDEFQGNKIDTRLWNVDTNMRDQAQQSEDSVLVKDGLLSIRTFTEKGRHFTGFLSSSGKFEALYGFYEARIKFTPAPGEWCAFWLQSNSIGNPMGDPARAGVEIDVVEHRLINAKGQNISNYQSINMHWDGYKENHKHIGSVGVPDPNGLSLTTGYHRYAVLWTPTEYVYYLDGRQVWSTKSPISHIPQHVRLTCEIKNKDWAGPIPPQGYGPRATSKIGMDVDWVRVWQKP